MTYGLRVIKSEIVLSNKSRDKENFTIPMKASFFAIKYSHPEVVISENRSLTNTAIFQFSLIL